MPATSVRPQFSEGFVRVDNGDIFYRKDGSGPPLVFVHGFCLDHRMWDEQFNYFSKFYTCINVDLRGFGKSSVPSQISYSHHLDLKTVLEGLKIKEKVVLIGLSMGGRVAANFALVYPHKTKALILADAAIDGYMFQDFDLSYIYQEGKAQGVAAANQLWIDHAIFDPAKNNENVSGRLKEMVLAYSGWHWINKNPIEPLLPHAMEQLHNLHLPTLILVGEKDVTDFHQISDVLHLKIRQSVKKTIKDAGHICNMENPALFNKIIHDFLVSLKD